MPLDPLEPLESQIHIIHKQLMDMDDPFGPSALKLHRLLLAYFREYRMTYVQLAKQGDEAAVDGEMAENNETAGESAPADSGPSMEESQGGEENTNGSETETEESVPPEERDGTNGDNENGKRGGGRFGIPRGGAAPPSVDFAPAIAGKPP